MPFTVNTSDTFDNWFTPLEEALQDDILFVLRLTTGTKVDYLGPARVIHV